MKEKKNWPSIVGICCGGVALAFAFIPIINTLSIILAVIGIVFTIIGFFKSKIVLPIIATILCIASGIIAYNMKIFVTEAVSDAFEEIDDSFADMTGENTEDILNTKITVEFGDFVDNGTFETKLPVYITNNTDETVNLDLTISATDANGVRFSDDVTYINSLASGQTVEETVFTIIDTDTATRMVDATFTVEEISIY